MVPNEERPDLPALRLAVFYVGLGHGAVVLHANRLAQGEDLVGHTHVAVRETLDMDEPEPRKFDALELDAIV